MKEESFKVNSTSKGVKIASEERKTSRRRIKRLSFTVVLLVVIGHLLGGLAAGIFIIARYFEKPKTQFVATKPVEMKPEDLKHRLAMDQMQSLRTKPILNNRIQSLKPSELVLPELPKVPTNSAVLVDTSSVDSSGIDGAGISSPNAGTGSSFFGEAGKAKSGLLEGVLYDLKQTRAGVDSKMDVNKYQQELERFARGASNILNRYFSAPDKLYLSRVFIPTISADDAPKAFKVADKVKPKMWVAVYKGAVIAPESGRFKFQGTADDFLLVWFNRRLVLDGGLSSISNIGRKPGTNLPGSRLPPTRPVEFEVVKGKVYPIQIAIGENPGGYFSAWLQIQSMGSGKSYWFRMTSEPITIKPEYRWDYGGPGNVSDQGPIWAPSFSEANL